jgi:hypothetical protein
MSTNAVIDYSKAVKFKYEQAKTELYSSFLLKPSPAEMKILCLQLFDNTISKQDQEIFDIFFELDDKTNKLKQIEYFSVDKLRPICNFLKGKTVTTRIPNLDMIAFLVDFNPRPYKKFVTANKNKWKDEIDGNDIAESKEILEGENKKSGFVNEKIKTKSVSKKLSYIAIPLLVFGSAGFGLKQFYFKNNDCLVWVKDHYEVYEYNEVKDTAEVIPYNKHLLDDFKKIIVSDTTVFFKNGDNDKPLVWYGKSVDKTE